MSSIPLPEAPPASSATFSDAPANNVTQQLQEAYRKTDNVLPSIPQVPTTSPWEEVLNPISVPTEIVVEETIEPVEPVESSAEVIPEEVVEELAPEIALVEPEVTTESETEVKPPKNSLLRSVLSSWLQKNKDNS